MTIVFGIDPGSVYTGFGVVKKNGAQLVHVDSGRISAGRSCKGTFIERLVKIDRDLRTLLALHRPSCIAIEQVFSQVNVASALKLGQARGVILLACEHQAPGCIFEFAPRAIKKSITGYGAATKNQIQYMVKKMLCIQSDLSEDAADALAIAILCASHVPVKEKK